MCVVPPDPISRKLHANDPIAKGLGIQDKMTSLSDKIDPLGKALRKADPMTKRLGIDKPTATPQGSGLQIGGR